MSFEQLQQTIQNEAQQKIDEINNYYDQQVATEENRIKERANQIEAEITSQAEKNGQMEAQRLHQSAQLKARAEVLTAKQSELDKVLSQAKEEILQKNEEETSNIISSLFELLPDEKGVIIAGEKHLPIIQKIAKQKDIPVKEEVIKDEGGFVFKGERMEFNATMSHLLKQIFDHKRSEIANILFG